MKNTKREARKNYVAGITMREWELVAFKGKEVLKKKPTSVTIYRHKERQDQ